MKTLNKNEMRKVEGGYRLYCTFCGKKSGSVGPLGTTNFYAWHKHWKWSGTYAIWDRSFRNSDKWYS